MYIYISHSHVSNYGATSGAGLEAGGDFSMCELGHVFECAHCDIFFFNPYFYHSCTEPHPREGGSRLFVSFYCKKTAFEAGALSAAMAERVGNAPLSLVRMR